MRKVNGEATLFSEGRPEEIYRSSRSHVLYVIVIMNKLAKYTGKHLQLSTFLIMFHAIDLQVHFKETPFWGSYYGLYQISTEHFQPTVSKYRLPHFAEYLMCKRFR